MKNYKILTGGVFVVCGMMMTSCFDNNYDLSDIDTNARVEVNNLTIPVNVSEIKLDKILDINDDPDATIQKIVDPVTGKEIYAVVEEGEFNSEEISIPGFTASAPNINPSTSTISLVNLNKELEAAYQKGVEDETKKYISQEVDNKLAEQGITPSHPLYNTLKPEIENEIKNSQALQDYLTAHDKEFRKKAFDNFGASNDEPLVGYEINTDPIKVETTSGDVTESIKKINKVVFDCSLKVKLTIGTSLANVINQVKLSKVKLQMPKGFNLTSSVGTYDAKTGILDLSKNDLIVASDGGYELTIKITGIDDPDAAGISLVPGDKSKRTKGVFSYKGNIFVESGEVSVAKNDFKAGKTFFDLPNSIDYTCSPSMTALEVKSVSGTIRYDVDKFNIDPVTLNDIPDALNDEQTNVILSNPQIYMTINNPLYNHKLYAKADIAITPEKLGEKRKERTTSLTLVGDRENNVFCISPNAPSKYYGDEAVTENIAFASLADILSVTEADGTIKNGGIPDKLYIDINEPCIPDQEVVDFKLDQKLGGIHGKYTFYAPLNLGDKSIVVYKDVADGWSDETLDKLTITNMKLEADVTSDIPLGAELNIHPVNNKGEVIPGVVFSTGKIGAKANNEHFTFELKSGKIEKLDGISFVATLTPAAGSENNMSATQHIILKNIKVTVGGYYDDEF